MSDSIFNMDRLMFLIIAAGIMFFIVLMIRQISRQHGYVQTVFRAASAVSPANGRACRHGSCRESNPPHAMFCRRCGKPLAAPRPEAEL